jgi:Tol biopolymer transport system component
MKRIALALVAALAVALALAPVASLGAGGGEPQTQLVSRAGLKGKGGDANSVDPSISADGRYVAFVSRAGNLDPAAPGPRQQVFVRDMQTGKTTLVSRASGAAGAAGNFASREPSISADGRYVAFASGATNLSPEAPTSGNIFVRDLATDTTILVSRASAPGNALADEYSSDPSISADGRHVAFESSASNLSSEDADVPSEPVDIFVRDLDTETTELVSRASGATGAAATADSFAPSISGDGRYVAFSSRSELAPEDFDQPSFPEDVFVRDRVAATTTLVSRATGPTGKASDVESAEAAISADGTHVAFRSDAKLTGQGGYTPNLFVRDVPAATTALVTVGLEPRAGRPFFHPSISADGRYVAFETGGSLTKVDAGNRVDVFARDMQKGITVAVSRASGSVGLPGDGPSFNSSISADGSFVAFDSRATNLSGADSDDASDVFRRSVAYVPDKPLPTCAGRPATLIGTPGPDKIKGTKRSDVIIALGGNDQIEGFSGGDTICAGAGKDVVDAGPNGGHGGDDLVLGGPGDDHLSIGPELGTLKGEGGNDVLIGSKGGDNLYGGAGNDVLRGGPNPIYNSDFLSGGPGNDKLFGGPGPDALRGGPGRNEIVPGPGGTR